MSFLYLTFLAPLAGFLLLAFSRGRLGENAAAIIGAGSVGVSTLVTALAAAQFSAPVTQVLWTWMHIGDFAPRFALYLDGLSLTMLGVVTGVGFLIHVFASWYMRGEEGYSRFFAYMNLFVASMVMLVLADNLAFLYLGWEGVGICSYLLIGFYYRTVANGNAAIKAFLVTRVGDVFMAIGLFILLSQLGTLDIQELLARAPERFASGDPLIVAATLMLLGGAVGKSAQLPLQTWLADAMAGPTPVSALIHAATMVTAGVYLVCRMAGVFVLSPAVMFTIALVGAGTALLAASIALVQNDIKKVLAYSTVSQLGYMFLGVGVGAFSAGFFHVLTHAFFKACLFLAAGSVIYAMHKRIHDTDASQDMRNMGGMKKYMPHTFAAFAMAWVAIIGVPGTSGFFSKDEILFKAYTSSVAFPIPDGKLIDPRSGKVALELWGWPSWGPTVLYAMGVLGAMMTAFYMSRLVFGIFWGDFKGWKIVKGWKEPEHDDHHGHHDDHHAGPVEGPKPQESPWQITVPILILGALSIVAGFLNAHPLHIAPLDHFLEPVFKFANGAKDVVAAGSKGAGVVEHPGAHGLMWPLMAPGLLALVAGAGGAFWVYLQQAGGPAKALAEKLPGLHALVYDKWRVDEFYEETIIGAVDSLAEFAVVFDRIVVDGIVARVTAFIVAATGTGLRRLQTGHVQAYAAVMVVGVGGLGWFFVAPHATTTVKPDEATGSYQITAAPGLGYQYRWDSDGDGKPDSDQFGAEASLSVSLERGQQKKVGLEVKNAFERVSKKQVTLSRPKVDASKEGPGVIQIEQGPDGQLRGVMPGQNKPLELRRPPAPPPGPGGPPPGLRMAPPPTRPNPAEPHQHQPGDVH